VTAYNPDEEKAMLDISQTPDPKGLRIVGDVDLATVDRFRSALAPLVREGGDIVVDMAEMRFIDSSGVQVIIRALEGLGDRGRLVLSHPRRTVVRMARVMGLQRFKNLEVQEDDSV
jgi:anti-anti-sigma factor